MRMTSILPIAWLMTACAPAAGPEEAVRLWLADAETAIEARDREGLVEMISGRYADARGNDRDDIDRMLRLYFLRSRKIVLASQLDELTVVDDSAADVKLIAGMAGSDTSVLGFSADAYRFELELERQDDGWRLIGARWGELGGELR